MVSGLAFATSVRMFIAEAMQKKGQRELTWWSLLDGLDEIVECLRVLEGYF